MLSKEMMYSCALWTEENGGVRGDLENGPTPGDLEEAQQEKLSWVLKKARVKPGHRLLEFGTGWGGLSIAVSHMFRFRGVKLALMVFRCRLLN